MLRLKTDVSVCNSTCQRVSWNSDLVSLIYAIGLTLVLNLHPAVLGGECVILKVIVGNLKVWGFSGAEQVGDSCDCPPLSPSALVHRQLGGLTSNRLQLQMFPAVCTCSRVCVRLHNFVHVCLWLYSYVWIAEQQKFYEYVVIHTHTPEIWCYNTSKKQFNLSEVWKF